MCCFKKIQNRAFGVVVLVLFFIFVSFLIPAPVFSDSAFITNMSYDPLTISVTIKGFLYLTGDYYVIVYGSCYLRDYPRTQFYSDDFTEYTINEVGRKDVNFVVFVGDGYEDYPRICFINYFTSPGSDDPWYLWVWTEYRSLKLAGQGEGVKSVTHWQAKKTSWSYHGFGGYEDPPVDKKTGKHLGWGKGKGRGKGLEKHH